MKLNRSIIFFLLFLGVSFNFGSARYNPREGDIIFQTSESNQSKLIEIATESKLTHCGLIEKYNNKWYVIEAAGPVRRTFLRDWIAGSEGCEYAIARLKNRYKINIKDVIAYAEKQLGKCYDFHFLPDDERFYCSEISKRGVYD